MKSVIFTAIIAGLILSTSCQKREKKTVIVESAPKGNDESDNHTTLTPSITVAIKDPTTLADLITDTGKLDVTFIVTSINGGKASDYTFLCTLKDITATLTSTGTTPVVCSKGEQGHVFTGMAAEKSYMITVSLKKKTSGEITHGVDAFFDTGVAIDDNADLWKNKDIVMVLSDTYDITVPRSMRIINYSSTQTIFDIKGIIHLTEIDDNSQWSWSCHDNNDSDHGLSSFPDYENGFNSACFKNVTFKELLAISHQTMSRNQLTLETTPRVLAATGIYETLIIREFKNATDFSTSANLYAGLCMIEVDGTIKGHPNAQLPGRYKPRSAEFRSCIGNYLVEAQQNVFVNQLISSDRRTEVIFISSQFHQGMNRQAYERITAILNHR